MSLRKQENLVYLILWAVVLLLPLTNFVQGTWTSDSGEAWKSIFRVWLKTVPLLFLFLIHNFLIARELTEKHRPWRYAGYLAAALLAFGVYCSLSSPGGGPDGPDRPERMEPRGTPAGPPGRDFDLDARLSAEAPPLGRPGEGGREGRPSDVKPRKAPAAPLTPEIIKFLVGLLVIGLNIAIKLFFKSIEEERKRKELEKEKLNSQLQALRYQVSPHFFMNTLNNIHALVDIDPQQAKGSILQLSKLMRYMLYEGDKPTIPLEKETAFLEQYISLMRLRYNDSVRIGFSVTKDAPGVEIPPLLFISFVENAFKHGVSYEHDSFIDVDMDIRQGRLLFTCRNSKVDRQDGGKDGGIGVSNTRHRLDLLYGDNYTMDITEDGDCYTIAVDIPVQPEKTEQT